MRWANEGEVKKILGASFDLSLDAHQVDKFLLEGLDKKLKY